MLQAIRHLGDPGYYLGNHWLVVGCNELYGNKHVSVNRAPITEEDVACLASVHNLKISYLEGISDLMYRSGYSGDTAWRAMRVGVGRITVEVPFKIQCG